MFRSPPQPMWDLTIHPKVGPNTLAGIPPRVHPLQNLASLLVHCFVSTPLQGSVSSLAHHSMSGSNTICNNTNPHLVDKKNAF